MTKKYGTKSLISLLSVVAVLMSTYAQAQDKIERKQLLVANVGTKTLKKVDVREISFKPGQKTGYHQHPCPVVGYITSGRVLFQVKGGRMKTLTAGDVFYEAANTPTVHFDNASATHPLKFIAYYLINTETELIQMLPQPK